jgi:hypothetical protein
MTLFRDTDEADEFIASGPSRETSPEIMKALAFFAGNLSEAEQLWDGEGWGVICQPDDFRDYVTENGRRDPGEFCWGATGRAWWPMDDLLNLPCGPVEEV